MMFGDVRGLLSPFRRRRTFFVLGFLKSEKHKEVRQCIHTMR